MKTILDKQITIKLIVIILVILIVVSGGLFFGNKAFKEYQSNKTIKNNILLIRAMAKVLAPVDGKCNIVNLNYSENGETKTEQVVNVLCANIQEQAPVEPVAPVIEPIINEPLNIPMVEEDSMPEENN